MIKEYIENLQIENERKLSDLDQEMQELVNDLSSAERMLEQMQQEKRIDTNIFSPRVMSQNRKIDDEIIEKQEKIIQLKQRMEYVTQMIEEGMNIREEYRRLKEELNEENHGEQPVPDQNLIDNSDGQLQENSYGESVAETPAETERVFSTEESPTEEPSIEEEEKTNSVDRAELITFLNDIYRRTETSIAFLNGNKNRCRAELKNCMRLIKDFAKKVENEEG